MKLLAIDSFSPVLSAALSNNDEIHFTQADTGMKHSELAVSLIDNLCKEADIKPADIEGVLCMEGPGSFTGLRIGYSIAKGLALSLSIPFAAIPTFDCIAHGINDSGIVLIVTDARKNAWFYAFFCGGKRLSDDGDGLYPQIVNELNNFKEKADEKIILAGPGALSFLEAAGHEQKDFFVLKDERNGYAKELILTACQKEIFKGDTSDYLISGPRYLRKSDAELNL